ncbi:hypothetical protein NLU13_4163 [Sarocladium strictum]|uniref:RBR-type E3 ubiquitin transferase n=1 Tax=Sarocladium strictum TaxID=5046 RepID=A0AA39L8D9_SARSR|nr:hypothetical protein NLU13_4163 [Sarocladium strictum]
MSAAIAKTAMATGMSLLPELDEVRYLREVLCLQPEQTEAEIDNELHSKANALGIVIPQSHAPSDKRYTSSAQSASTAVTYHGRTFSTGSHGSASTAFTDLSFAVAPPSPGVKSADGTPKKRTKVPSFSQYDKYLSTLSPNLDQPKIRKLSKPLDASSQSLFSVRTGKSFFSLKSYGLRTKMRWRRQSNQPFDLAFSCVCCRETFEKPNALHALPCSHSFCSSCLKVIVQQATTDESKMPPRCCTQPVPSNVLRNLLSKENQQSFLKAVAQFSTPWEARIFCPNAACGEFIPPRAKVDPKHPFSVSCYKCQTQVCTMCKREAHGVGKDCPEDWELEQVLKMGEKSGWRRCYKCRTLVELTQGCTHVTCRCKAQFCYVCGGIWDATLGCPNVCNGEEELERRRIEERRQRAEVEAETAAHQAAEAIAAAGQLEAEARSKAHPEVCALQKAQLEELARFEAFSKRVKEESLQRHSELKKLLQDKHTDQEEKMKERHTKTANHLEDRQIAAEMELRSTLEASERSVRIRLKHMEAYCDGLGRTGETSKMPARTVTERDLRELGQQYNLRDGMERLHQSKINVMRDRQAKRMEELLERHEAEISKLEEQKREDLEDLAARFAHEHDALASVLKERQLKLEQRWEIAMEVLCKELQKQDGQFYAVLPRPQWLDELPENTENYPEKEEDKEEVAAL